MGRPPFGVDEDAGPAKLQSTAAGEMHVRMHAASDDGEVRRNGLAGREHASDLAFAEDRFGRWHAAGGATAGRKRIGEFDGVVGGADYDRGAAGRRERRDVPGPVEGF